MSTSKEYLILWLKLASFTETVHILFHLLSRNMRILLQSNDSFKKSCKLPNPNNSGQSFYRAGVCWELELTEIQLCLIAIFNRAALSGSLGCCSFISINKCCYGYRSTGIRTQLNRTGKVINKNVKCWNFNKTKPMCLPIRSCLNNRLHYCPVQQQIHATACCLSARAQANPHICKDQSKPTVLTQGGTHMPTHTLMKVTLISIHNNI